MHRRRNTVVTYLRRVCGIRNAVANRSLQGCPLSSYLLHFVRLHSAPNSIGNIACALGIAVVLQFHVFRCLLHMPFNACSASQDVTSIAHRHQSSVVPVHSTLQRRNPYGLVCKYEQVKYFISVLQLKPTCTIITVRLKIKSILRLAAYLMHLVKTGSN